MIGEPDYLDLVEEEYDWASTIYGESLRSYPRMPQYHFGNFIMLSHYVDANLYHDMLTGRSVTGILHYCMIALKH